MTSLTRDSETGKSIQLLDLIRKWGSKSYSLQDLSGNSADNAQGSAAVSFALKPSGQELEVLLLQRQLVERDPWSGQISFPGGRSKPGETLLQTARRETLEETGLDLDSCEIVGRMRSIYPGNRSINVTPFVVITSELIAVSIDRDEIADFIWAPLNYFSDEKNSQVYTFSRQGSTIQTPSFVIAGKYIVWGMTLKIIQNLLSELKEI